MEKGDKMLNLNNNQKILIGLVILALVLIIAVTYLQATGFVTKWKAFDGSKWFRTKVVTSVGGGGKIDTSLGGGGKIVTSVGGGGKIDTSVGWESGLNWK